MSGNKNVQSLFYRKIMQEEFLFIRITIQLIRDVDCIMCIVLRCTKVSKQCVKFIVSFLFYTGFCNYRNLCNLYFDEYNN